MPSRIKFMTMSTVYKKLKTILISIRNRSSLVILIRIRAGQLVCAHMLTKRAPRGAKLGADSTHIGGMVHVACLHVFVHVALFLSHVAAVEAGPALLALRGR